MVLWRGGSWKCRGRDSPLLNGAKSWVAGPSLALTQSQRLCHMPHCFHASLIYWEFPRLCRGGSRSLTFPGVPPVIRRRNFGVCSVTAHVCLQDDRDSVE